VDVIHLHHGVWLNASRGSNALSGALGGEIFFASGEEKTILQLPPGYGYPVKASDLWFLNHMIHNLTSLQDQVWMTYEIDFVPADSELGRTLKPARPVWTDVERGAYPVFDVLRGTGGDGQFTYPDEARDPYGARAPANELTLNRDGTLLTALGHVHPGGLWTDLDLIRPGARGIDREGHRLLHARVSARHARGHRRLGRLRRRGVSRRRRAREHRRLHRRLSRLHRDEHPGLERRERVRIFHSEARYYDPGGPISWDMSMTATRPDWRVGVREGDKLRISATYETERASWYESMGIILLYMSDEEGGPDPFTERIETTGEVTHGHLPENENHGGRELGLPDPAGFPDGGLGRTAAIAGFNYLPGDQAASGAVRNPPVVPQGESLRFQNLDAAANVFHTITACRPPCNKATGISFPLADGPVDFDSGQLGFGPPGFTAAAQRTEWRTPKDLQPGTYTYFCRVHPFMRGAFRVKPAD
jgi:hypothetical protein